MEYGTIDLHIVIIMHNPHFPISQHFSGRNTSCCIEKNHTATTEDNSTYYTALFSAQQHKQEQIPSQSGRQHRFNASFHSLTAVPLNPTKIKRSSRIQNTDLFQTVQPTTN